MDPWMVTLRILHEMFGLLLVGNTLFLTLFLEPRLKALGPSFQNPVMGAVMPIVVPVQMVSFVIMATTGAVLTLKIRGGTLDGFFDVNWGWAMLVGIIATAAAGVIGFGLVTPNARRLEKLGRAIRGRAPTAAEGSELSRLGHRLTTLSRTNSVLCVVVIAAMAAARYV